MELAADRPKLLPLTSLRFFAAGIVVAYHYNPDRFLYLPSFFRAWFETGYQAVTFFFVLSGFILSYIYAEADRQPHRDFDVRGFFIARFARLAPAYYTALLVALPFIIVDAFVWDAQPVDRFALHGALVVTFLQSWWPSAAQAWNPPAWSLSVEWFLYLMFPLIAEGARRVSASVLLAISFILVVCVAAFRLRLVLIVDEIELPVWDNFAFYFPLFHLPQFVFGVALGRLHLFGPRPSATAAGAIFVAAIVALMLLFGGWFHVPAWLQSDAVLVVLFGLLINGAAQEGHFVHRALSVAPLLFLGEISYSIYLLHEPVALWWEWLKQDAFDVQLSPRIDFPIYVAMVLGASALCFLYIERPLRRLIRRPAARNQRRE